MRSWPWYGRAALTTWVDRIEAAFGDCRSADVFVYFNNDPGEAALHNAVTFARVAARRGMSLARVDRSPAVMSPGGGDG